MREARVAPLLWAVMLFTPLAVAAHAEQIVLVTTAADLVDCIETPRGSGAPRRICRITQTIQGPLSAWIASDPPEIAVECDPGAAIEWASDPAISTGQDAFAVRIPPNAPQGWRVTLRNCDVSDLAPPGGQHVQGPILANYSNVPGTYVWEGVTYSTQAYGTSTVGGGINPDSTTELIVRNSFVFAPICWDAKSYTPDGSAIVHEFTGNHCIANDRPEVAFPRALKIQGATHVVSTGNVWEYGQMEQSKNQPNPFPVAHVFSGDIFHHRANPPSSLSAVFVSGSDVAWTVTGTLDIEDLPGPDPIHRSWNKAVATFDAQLKTVIRGGASLPVLGPLGLCVLVAAMLSTAHLTRRRWIGGWTGRPASGRPARPAPKPKSGNFPPLGGIS
jgi:hypothetical protein